MHSSLLPISEALQHSSHDQSFKLASSEFSTVNDCKQASKWDCAIIIQQGNVEYSHDIESEIKIHDTSGLPVKGEQCYPCTKESELQ